MGKCISVPHDRKTNFAFLLMRKKYFDWGISEKKNYEHNLQLPMQSVPITT
jgi:hypothetical protein